MQSLKYTGRTLTIKNKHKFGISTRYTPSCPTIQYDVYPIVSDTTLIPHLLQYIQLRKELTLCADLKLHNCYCTCSSINSFLVYISGLICQNHQNYKAMNWKVQSFFNIYWLIWLRFEFLVRLTQVLYMSFDLFFFFWLLSHVIYLKLTEILSACVLSQSEWWVAEVLFLPLNWGLIFWKINALNLLTCH